MSADVDALLGELLLTPEGRRDPYPRYERIRELAAVHRSGLGFWVLSRYEDCQQLLRDPRFGKGDRRDREAGLPEEAVAALARMRTRAPSLLFLDPPDHTRLRGLVAKAFTPRTVERLRPHIGRLLDELLEAVDGGVGETVDVMAAVAVPLPVTVIGEMLGVPPADRVAFQPWVRALTALLELTVDAEAVVAAAEASDRMTEYFTGLLADRRRHPGEDLLSELLRVEDQGDTLSEAELVATAILLFGAGFETTANLIGNGLLALLRHPDQLARLRADPGLLRPAVEEILRWDSPVQVDGRMALAAADVHGEPVEEGTFVVTMLGAANRDPARFDAPDRFDVARDEGPPLSFGSGIHYCLGQALARVEGQVVFGRLLERYAAAELAGDDVAYRPSLTLRGLVDLPVVLTPASGSGRDLRRLPAGDQR
jgi:cytochrome P450